MDIGPIEHKITIGNKQSNFEGTNIMVGIYHSE
jgi:hypothetical protein